MNRVILIVLVSAFVAGTWCFPQASNTATTSEPMLSTQRNIGAGRNGTANMNNIKMSIQVESTMSSMGADNGTSPQPPHHKKHKKHHQEKRSAQIPSVEQMKKKKGGKRGKNATTQASA